MFDPAQFDEFRAKPVSPFLYRLFLRATPSAINTARFVG